VTIQAFVFGDDSAPAAVANGSFQVRLHASSGTLTPVPQVTQEGEGQATLINDQAGDAIPRRPRGNFTRSPLASPRVADACALTSAGSRAWRPRSPACRSVHGVSLNWLSAHQAARRWSLPS